MIVKPGERWLIWRLRRGDREAARELIRVHHGAVYGYLRRLGADGALAEDLTQETYARAWTAIGGLRREASLRAWLLAIARNQFLQLARRRGSGARTADISVENVPEPADSAPGAFGALTARQRDARLHRAVNRLDPTLREAVALHYFQDLTLREVGAVLGIPSGTVKSRLNRALAALRRELAPQEVSNDERSATGTTTAGTL